MLSSHGGSGNPSVQGTFLARTHCTLRPPESLSSASLRRAMSLSANSVGCEPRLWMFPNIPKVPGIVEAAIHWKVEGKTSHLLTACILDDMDWPSFWARGQIGVARSAHLFFKRESPADRARVTETMETLCPENHGVTCWIGNPGIGNSAGLNEILVALLRALGQPGFPAVVGFRVNEDVIIWRWNAISTTVSVSVERGNEEDAFYGISSVIQEENGVLVVDSLSEDEPYLRSACATVAALSNEQLEFNLNCSHYMVVGPWALSECTAAAWVESRLGREDLGCTLSEVTDYKRTLGTCGWASKVCARLRARVQGASETPGCRSRCALGD